MKFFFSVGEPSGDLHAAKLIEQLQKAAPNVQTMGLGGKHMQKAGCDVQYDLTQLAVVGFVEVVPKLREFFRVADLAAEMMDRERPDAVVLVDFPGFNWHIAKRAKERGIPVFYFLPPQLWAWGSWRVKKLRRLVDHVFCNLPFEAQWYSENDVPNEYVGHPFFDEVAEHDVDARLLAECQTESGSSIAVLPGSRNREVKTIWPMQLKIIDELSQRHPSAAFHIACLRQEHHELCQQILKSQQFQHLQDRLRFHVGKTSSVIEACDCALMKSGSVSLEMMARQTPAVVVYHVGYTLYAASRLLTKLKSMTLPNLIAEQTIMPEFLAVGKSQKAVEQAIASMDRLLSDPDELTRQREQLKALNDRFATPGAAQRTARSLLKRLGSNDVASSVGDIVGSDDPSFSAAPETDERAA